MTLEGNPWFVAADVCRAIGVYARHDGTINTSTATRTLDASERRTLPYEEAKIICLQSIASRAHGLTVISESGLYKIILRAERTRPEVVKFQDWVTKEVLPASPEATA
ncbi:MAG: Bro-N domain-containing protein [Betaproteobacteria bacterium]|nr:Bro-N domain-containing protein [Betaproteobacteria bacterium]MCL2886021.1 Bro-N domain-containing protein [Betaproteobacteria bacterium]